MCLVDACPSLSASRKRCNEKLIGKASASGVGELLQALKLNPCDKTLEASKVSSVGGMESEVRRRSRI